MSGPDQLQDEVLTGEVVGCASFFWAVLEWGTLGE